MSGEGKTAVLYADDSKDDAFFMRRAFRKAGLEESLVIVYNGPQAISYLSADGIYSNREKHPFPAFALLDIKMPIVSGFQVLSWIRGTLGKALPVFMLSSSSQDRDVQEALSSGANGYLVKPSNGDRLSEVLVFVRDFCSEEKNLRDRWVQFKGIKPLSIPRSSV